MRLNPSFLEKKMALYLVSVVLMAYLASSAACRCYPCFCEGGDLTCYEASDEWGGIRDCAREVTGRMEVSRFTREELKEALTLFPLVKTIAGRNGFKWTRDRKVERVLKELQDKLDCKVTFFFLIVTGVFWVESGGKSCFVPALHGLTVFYIFYFKGG